jgi:hypothetical protein
LKIKWYPDKSMSEIYQQTGMQFALLGPLDKKVHKQCHPFVLCRDFLHDAVKAHLNKSKWQIHGFIYEYGKYPAVDMDMMRMLVRKKFYTSKPTEVTIKGAAGKIKKFEEDMVDFSLRLIHHYENIGGIEEKSIIDKDIDDVGNPVFIFTGSPVWMSSPFLVSMYTYLIRLGDKEIVSFETDDDLRKGYQDLMKDTKGNDNDISYLRKNWDKLHIVMTRREELFGKDAIHKIYFDKVTNSMFHNNCGIFNLCNLTSADKSLNDKLRKMVAEASKDGKEKVNKS